MAKLTITGNSTQATTYKNGGIGNFLLSLYERGGNVKELPFTYTNTTGGTLADGSIIELAKCGPCRVMPGTTISISALGASRVLNLGLQEYTDRNGATVASAITALLTGLDVSSAVNGQSLNIVTTSGAFPVGFDVNGQSALLAQVTGGTIPNGATIKGILKVIAN